MPKATEANSRVRSSNDEGADPVVRLSILVTCAAVLQVAESLLPHPLPGVRLGLANIITVIAMVYIGPGSAVQLAVLRTLVSSMVLGTFLTPTFALSFSGGVVSALVMVLLYRLSGRGRFSFGLVGISVGGSVSHIATQVALVYLLFIRSSGVLWLWPWLALSAVVMGVLTGTIAVQAVRRLEAGHAGGATPAPLAVSARSDLSARSDRNSGLRIIDVSDPASPAELGSLDTPGQAMSVRVQNGYAYVSDATSGLRVIDCTSPAHLVERAFYDTPHHAWAAWLDGSRVYVADFGAGLQIYEATLGVAESDAVPPVRPFTLGPNPVRDRLLVKAPSLPGSSTLSLYDCAGKLVRQFNLGGRVARVSVRGFAPGIYVARLGSLTEKFAVVP